MKKTRKAIITNNQMFRKNLFVLAMLIIPLAHFAFFYIYINVSSFFLAFQTPKNDGSGLIIWGFDNFKTLLEQFKNIDSTIIEALRNTFIWFITQNFVCLPLSLIICYFIYKKIKHYTFFRMIIYLPCIISGTIFITLFKYMVGTGGPFFALLDFLGKDYIYFFRDSTYAMKGMLFYVITMTLGGHFILFGGAMNAINYEQIEAGQLDGCTPWRELISIIIPNIWPTLSTMLLIGFTGILGASGPVFLFTRGEFGTNTLSYWIFDLTLQGSSGNDNLAAAIGLLMSLITIPIVFTVKKIMGVTKDD